MTRFALLLALIAVACPLKAHAQSAEIFATSLRIPVISGTAIVDCPERARGNSSETELVCVQFPQGQTGGAVSFAYFNELTQDRWIFSNFVAPTYIFVRWQNPNCVEHVAMSAVEDAPGVIAFLRPLQPVCGNRRYGGEEE
ncbi:MAG: hypothetical protein NT015_12015 [Alphaproteobacteria bacterium]|nr:hypothetical protein [Alphaproteobacteria bacterium]